MQTNEDNDNPAAACCLDARLSDN